MSKNYFFNIKGKKPLLIIKKILTNFHNKFQNKFIEIRGKSVDGNNFETDDFNYFGDDTFGMPLKLPYNYFHFDLMK